jgi:hypothetical protein
VELQRLLDEARRSLPGPAEPNDANAMDFAPDRGGTTQSSDEHLALDDAENPLQLLARATDLRISSPSYSEQLNASTPSSQNLAGERGQGSNVNQFFQPIKADLDGGGDHSTRDTDPIELGLVTMEEAEMLMLL